MGVGGLVGVGVQQDDKDPTTYVVSLGQSGIGLPDRDYYLKDDAKLATIRTAYQAYLTRMLTLAGEPNAATRAAAVFNMEKGLATAHWTRIESRDADKTYNKWTAADFAAKAPGFPWAQYMTAMGVTGRPFYLVAQPSAVTGEAKVFADTPINVLQDYAMLKVLRSYAPYLSSDFDKTNFAFYGTTLSGTPEQQVRWKRGVSTVSGAMGEAIGQQYVAKYFPPASKAAADDLVKNVIAAMGERLRNLEWMAPETKTKALAKLAAFTPKIGYPDKWRDYSALQIQRGDLVGNVARANAFEYDRDLKKLGQADRSRRVVHDADDDQRLCQSDDERGRLPGRDPPAAVLRSEGGPGGQLRRHRRGDRSRDQPPLRRPGPQIRSQRQAHRLVDAAGRRALQGVHRRAREAV